LGYHLFFSSDPQTTLPLISPQKKNQPKVPEDSRLIAKQHILDPSTSSATPLRLLKPPLAPSGPQPSSSEAQAQHQKPSETESRDVDVDVLLDINEKHVSRMELKEEELNREREKSAALEAQNTVLTYQQP
jgi:hypothetical protein